MKNKKTILLVIAVIGVVSLILGASYALYTFNITKNSNFKIKVGKLEMNITDTETEDRVIINNIVPTQDSVALTEDGYSFTVTNTGTVNANYEIFLDNVNLPGETKERLSNDYIKINLSQGSNINSEATRILGNNNYLTSGMLEPNQSVTYTLRLWLSFNVGNESMNKYFASRIRIESIQSSSQQTTNY